MNKTIKYLIVIGFLLIASLMVSSDIIIPSDDKTNINEKTKIYHITIDKTLTADFIKIKKCSVYFWNTTEDVTGICEKCYNIIVEYFENCKVIEEINGTNYCIKEECYDSKCVIGTEEVEHNKTDCIDLKTSLIEIDNTDTEVVTNWVCDYKEYECIVKDDVITCDSKRDGNGDGICQSGERCFTIEITKDGLGLIKNIEFERQAEDFKDNFNEFDIKCTKQ